MAVQVYECPEHGEFEVHISMLEPTPQEYPCRHIMGEHTTHWYCERLSPHVLKPPHINVVGGTTPPR